MRSGGGQRNNRGLNRPARIAILLAGGLLGAYVAAAIEHMVEEVRWVEHEQQVLEDSILPSGNSPPVFEPLATSYRVWLYAISFLVAAWFARRWIKPLPHPSRARLHYPGAIGLAALVCGFPGAGVLIGLNLLFLARYRDAVLAVLAGFGIGFVLAVILPDTITLRVAALVGGVVATRVWLADELRRHPPLSAVRTVQVGWLLAFLSTATIVHLGWFELPR